MTRILDVTMRYINVMKIKPAAETWRGCNLIMGRSGKYANAMNNLSPFSPILKNGACVAVLTFSSHIIFGNILSFSICRYNPIRILSDNTMYLMGTEKLEILTTPFNTTSSNNQAILV